MKNHKSVNRGKRTGSATMMVRNFLARTDAGEFIDRNNGGAKRNGSMKRSSIPTFLLKIKRAAPDGYRQR